MFGTRREKAFDVASARKMLANRPKNDDTHPWISVERLEGKAELIALRHLDDVERRPIEDDVGALSPGIQFDAKAVELRRKFARDGNVAFGHVWLPSLWRMSLVGSGSNSPATSLRLRSLPTGDFGTSLTNTKSRGRLKLARFE